MTRQVDRNQDNDNRYELQAHAPAHQLLAGVRAFAAHHIPEPKQEDHEHREDRHHCEVLEQGTHCATLQCDPAKCAIDGTSTNLGQLICAQGAFAIGRTAHVYYGDLHRTTIAAIVVEVPFIVVLRALVGLRSAGPCRLISRAG